MFDWDAETWERAAQRALDLVNRVSTGWSDRRPGPAAGPDEILSAFKEPLPRTPSSFEEIAERLETVVKHSAFIGHPRWLAYITACGACSQSGRQRRQSGEQDGGIESY